MEIRTKVESKTNETVVERGEATFACSGTVDGTAQPTRYTIRSSVTVRQSVALNISDLVTVNGTDAALVFGDFNSHLLLSGIPREADGYTVVSSVRVGAVFLDAMNVPLTFVSCSCLPPPPSSEVNAVLQAQTNR